MPTGSVSSVVAKPNIADPDLSVPLIAKKVPRLLGYLDYYQSDLMKKQGRFAGRYALCPDIDLGKFTTRAVIDWLTMGLVLSRPTQFHWIQREVKALMGGALWVTNTAGEPNDASVAFDMRIQEPDISTVLEAVAAIRAKFGLAVEPVVQSIEISVDFTPRIPDELERAKIARVLINHLLVKPDVISNLRDRPRTITARGPEGVMRLLYDSSRLSEEENKEFLVSTERDRAPFTDGTFGLGAKEADVRWGVMDKIIDQQNVPAGTFVVLDEKLKRVRIEVTLGRKEVEALGVTLIDDLRHLNFTRLQGKYFKFFLPTFSRAQTTKPRLQSAIVSWKDRQRTIKFSKTGNTGLKAMDDVLAEQRTTLRHAALPGLHERGLRIPNLERRGGGSSGTFVAYEDMDKRVQTSLRNLGKRVAGDFGSDD